MEIVWSKVVDEVLNVGYFLEEFGIRDWALTRSQALHALDEFSRLQIPIFGGDVCENISGRIFPNRDNWYCDPLPNETRRDFVARSISTAKNYIENYKSPHPNKIFFTIVPDVGDIECR